MESVKDTRLLLAFKYFAVTRYGLFNAISLVLNPGQEFLAEQTSFQTCLMGGATIAETL